MKKLKIGLIAFGVVGLMGLASPALAKPASSWQIYYSGTDRLVVYDTNYLDKTSKVVFQGYAEDYNGQATSPAAPTSEYLQKQSDTHRAFTLRDAGKTEEADKIMARWKK